MLWSGISVVLCVEMKSGKQWHNCLTAPVPRPQTHFSKHISTNQSPAFWSADTDLTNHTSVFQTYFSEQFKLRRAEWDRIWRNISQENTNKTSLEDPGAATLVIFNKVGQEVHVVCVVHVVYVVHVVCIVYVIHGVHEVHVDHVDHVVHHGLSMDMDCPCSLCNSCSPCRSCCPSSPLCDPCSPHSPLLKTAVQSVKYGHTFALLELLSHLKSNLTVRNVCKIWNLFI